MKIKQILLLGFLSLTLACKYSVSQKNKTSDHKSAKEITNRFYNCLSSNNRIELYGLFGQTPKFTKSQIKNILDLTLNTVDTKYGKIKSRKIQSIETNVSEREINGGVYDVTFEVIRENKRCIDTFKLTRQSGEVKIMDYFVTPA
ncbi:hypothetical protein [Pedobacter suwonensis]|uniref:hypothetical protein n=1 Tax=Pedobacter suwonensis TaxID=332999 RepID=UPI00119EEF9F|nr:hypothetical protein [Pedobacter suwonensis]